VLQHSTFYSDKHLISSDLFYSKYFPIIYSCFMWHLCPCCNRRFTNFS